MDVDTTKSNERGMRKSVERREARQGLSAGQYAIAETRYEVEAVKRREIKWFHDARAAVKRREETGEKRRIVSGLAWVVRESRICAKSILLFFRRYETMLTR
jgi:hypothetical protein